MIKHSKVNLLNLYIVELFKSVSSKITSVQNVTLKQPLLLLKLGIHKILIHRGKKKTKHGENSFIIESQFYLFIYWFVFLFLKAMMHHLYSNESMILCLILRVQ